MSIDAETPGEETISVSEAGRRLNVSRARAYQLAKAGTLPIVIRDGKQRVLAAQLPGSVSELKPPEREPRPQDTPTRRAVYDPDFEQHFLEWRVSFKRKMWVVIAAGGELTYDDVRLARHYPGTPANLWFLPPRFLHRYSDSFLDRLQRRAFRLMTITGAHQRPSLHCTADYLLMDGILENAKVHVEIAADDMNRFGDEPWLDRVILENPQDALDFLDQQFEVFLDNQFYRLLWPNLFVVPVERTPLDFPNWFLPLGEFGTLDQADAASDKILIPYAADLPVGIPRHRDRRLRHR